MTEATTSPAPGPVEHTPMSFDDGVSAIESLLSDDRESDPKGTDGAKPVEVKPEAKEAEDDSELVLDDAEDDENADVETAAPSAVTDETEVTLEDGTKISIGQLKRNNLFQRDYSKKTEEFQRHREAEEAKLQKLRSEAETEISQNRERLLQVAAKYFPKRPTTELLNEDPIAYMHAVEDYNQRVAEMQALDAETQQQNEQRTQKQKEEAEQFKAQGWDQFITANSHLKNADKLKAFRDDVKKYALGDYKLTAEEIQSVADPRFMQIIHDAILYRRAKEKAVAVKSELAPKPKLMTQQRMSTQAAVGRDRSGRFEALRQARSIDAAARSIEDLL